jgi:hypothetical protein
MRSLATLTFMGCANVASSPIPYDETARTIGADTSGDHHALADAAILAHGGMPPRFTRDELGLVSGTHDDLRYLYKVVCYDASDRGMDCGESTAWATAITVWTGQDARHEGIWTLYDIDSHVSWATGTTWSVYGGIIADKQAAVLYDLDRLTIAGGSMTAAIEVGDTSLRASIVFERPDRARIEIDDLAWWLDPTTGTTAAAVTLE